MSTKECNYIKVLFKNKVFPSMICAFENDTIPCVGAGHSGGGTPPAAS